MQTSTPTADKISSCPRPSAIALGLLLLFGFAQATPAQTPNNQLKISNNYFLTGDYVVGGVGLRGTGVSGMAKGTITIPDAASVPAAGVPAGANIVAAFLYWETVEKSATAYGGQNGYFNGFAITGDVLGTPGASTYWGPDGCSNSSDGHTTLQAYRADVRPYLPLDANGNIQTPNAATPGQYQVSLADHNTDGDADADDAPFTLGASLVIIYRVLAPAMPLNAIVIYDGAATPTNSLSQMSQQITGFYQASASPNVKLTHIVGNGQPSKPGYVFVNNVILPNLVSGVAPFPGNYFQNQYLAGGGGSWDNPTWYGGNSFINFAVPPNDEAPVTVTVSPNGGSDCGCVNWGIVIFSTTVQDSDGDGLLDVWKANQGYTDAISGQFVALPGAKKGVRDLFVEADYLSNLDGSAGAYLHSHLPKQAALDTMGDAFAKQSVKVHFDVGPTNYAGNCSATNPSVCPDPYIIQGGTGGNAISEGATVCTDSTTLCQYPGAPSVGWKEGLLFIKNNATLPGNSSVPLGNFQSGRKDSYHYVLFGHDLASPASYWTTFGATVANSAFAQLISIVNSGTTATVTIQSPPPPGVVKPGDCPNSTIPACSTPNSNRVTVAGALGQPALNGTYPFTNVSSSTNGSGVITTTFNITTSGVANGTYNFGNESRLQLTYLGPNSSSGHSDLGGGDSIITFGLWGADDPTTLPLCQGDPSQALLAGQAYCNNQVGTVLQQAGTLMHEVGHTLSLTHGGAYYSTPSTPSVASYDPNCKPNFLSVMSYMFQVRGFPDGGIDYSAQTLQPLDETNLNETLGIGLDIFTGQPAVHSTRWYAPPNALDTAIGRFATAHCDGSPIGPGEPPTVRLDGNTPPSQVIDWDNNLIVPDLTEPVLFQDVNFLGSTIGAPEAPFQGFNDWTNIELNQIGARENALGYSGGTGAGARPQAIGGGVTAQAIGGGALSQAIGGGASAQAIGGGVKAQAIGGGAMAQAVGGGTELDVETANSTADAADAPTGLTAVESGITVVLNWVGPAFGQPRSYFIWRAVGSFPTLASVNANIALFTNIGSITGAPPSTTFSDTTVTPNTYTYFITEKNIQGVLSGPSTPAVVLVQGSTTTGIIASPASPVYGQQLTLTATVASSVSGSSIVPTGSVAFSDGATALGTVQLAAGAASFTTTSALALGSHSIGVSYSGDTNFFAGTSSITLTVSQAATTTTISTSPAAPVYGQPLTVTATVGPVSPGAGTPTGTVTFADGPNSLGTASLSGGQGSITISTLGAGNHSFSASYSGDTNFTGSTPAMGYSQTISQAPATVALSSLTATYDGTPKSAAALTTPSGLNVNFTYNGSPTPPTNAGTYAVVATINDPNYQGTLAGMLTISTRMASVTPNAATKVYGMADPGFSGTLTGFVATDSVTATYSRTAGQTVAGSPYTISVTLSPAGVLANYAVTYNTASFSITPAAASVTPNVSTKVYGAADPVFTGTLTGFVGSDGVTATYSRTAGQSVAGSPYTISAILSPAGVLGNYTITYNTASFSITPAAASVTPNAASKVYGTSDPVFTGTLTGFVASDGVTATYSRTAGQTVAGSPYTISATLSPAGVLANYTITYNTASFSITLAAASVTPNAATRVYGTADPVFTGTLAGFQASDGVTATYTRTAGQTVGGSPYIISATLSPAGVLANYTITYKTASFSITPAAASVTPNAATKVYGATDPVFTGTLTGFQASDGVTATYTRTTGQTAAGSPYIISATLSPAGVLGNYSILYNTALFTITKAAATLTLGNLTQAYTGSPLTPTVTTVPAGLSYTLTGAPDTAAGSYQVTATVTDPNYTGTASGTFVITRPGASVSPTSLAFGTIKCYSSASKAVTLTNTGTGTLTISSIKITTPGVDPDDVSISAKTCGSTLAAGASCTITVTYKADFDDSKRSPTTVIATLAITDNAPTPTQTVPISGN